MAFALLSSVCSLATKLTATIKSSPSPSSSSSILSLTNGTEEDLEKLQRTLRRIQALLADAERREILDDSVKLWVKELKGVAYDAEDVLEDYQYELLRIQAESRIDSVEATRKRKREQEEQQLWIPKRIRNIMERFDEISKDRVALHLREGDGIRRPDVSMNGPQPTSSHVDESGIFGREQNKDEVIEMLLADESCRFSVIPIVGMAGLGKTTLAQLVYNNQRVQQYFDYTGWVCVSDNFDVSRLTKEMIESISKKPCNLRQLNAVQDILKEKVKGKKVLLVLDDVWNEQQGPWDSFRAPLSSAQTIRIIATTRNDPVAEVMQTVAPYRPACLSHDQCWSLFRHHAFRDRDPEDYPHMEEIGRKIIEKCGRLPLSVKAIGGLLHYEFDEDRWTDILGSDLWNLDQARRDILPALMLSYHHLPPHLKPCFLFTSLFPKDYYFSKSRIVKLWIAQGFILPSGSKRLKDIGRQYFDELQRRSLFQSAYGYGIDFVLHDAIHDLARSISDNEYLSITLESDAEVQQYIPKEVRHLFVLCKSVMTVDHLKIYDPRALRTLIVEEYMWRNQTSIVNLDSLGCLRAVELRGQACHTSLSNLKHLRHLYIGNESSDNQEIFIDIGNLVSLQHLRLSGPAVFPGVVSVQNNELGLMKCPCYPTFSNLWKYVESDGILRCLAKLIIKHNSKLSRLPFLSSSLQSLKVRDCTNLTSLSCLLNLTSLRKLHLSNCPHLQFGQEESLPLKLEDVHISDCLEVVLVPGLNNLTSLRKLHLSNCPQLQFGQEESLPLTIEDVHISYCEELLLVPALKNLTSLRKLHLSNCHNLQFGQEESLPLKLEDVHISDCWEVVLVPGLKNLTSLRKLHLSNCHYLQFGQEESLPAKLEDVHISDCLEVVLVPGLKNLTSLSKLHLSNCPQLQFGQEESLPLKLEDVHISDCWEMLLVPGLKNLTSLRKLHLSDCQCLQFGQEESLPSKLEDVHISDCWKLMLVPGLKNLTSLRKLHLSNCRQLQFGQEDSLPLKLEDVRISDCWEVLLVPGLKNLTSLRKLHLLNCHHLQFGQEESLPSKLEDVRISDCWKLMSVTELKNLTSLKSLVLQRCPLLQISPDELLPCTPQVVVIRDCLRLKEWCKRHHFLLEQHLSIMEELTITSTSDITQDYGVDNLSSLNHLRFLGVEESYLTSAEWLPPTVQTLVVCSSENLMSLSLHQNVSSLKKLTIKDCLKLTSVVGIQNLNSLKELVITNCPELQLSPNEYLPCSLHSLKVSDCKSLRSLPRLHHKMSAFDMLKLSNCSMLTDVFGLSDVPSLWYGIIWDCPEVLLSSEERLRINCPPQLELATSGLRPQQSGTMAPAKKIDAAVGSKDQFLQLGLPMDHASNSLMELPLSTEINAEPQQT